MKRINLILGCHSHQPVGNFDFVFQEAYEKSYVPFIDVLERFPAVRVTLHYTGPLWDWFIANHPDYVKRLRGLVEAGQVEIMGGGYYEPMLCAIPERDALAQIKRMQAFCLEHFGEAPKGMWLAERVWEPHMARILAQSGVTYTALDDSHFLCSGLGPDDLYGCYMTEEEGETIRVFPILEKLRYLVPFHRVDETISYLRELATEDGERCAVLHDDGEKFGVWPGTFHSVYEEGWLESFFTALSDNRDWLQSVTYSEYLAEHRPIGRTYITCASYQEMMAWALPPRRQRELKEVREALSHQPALSDKCAPFLRGGFWRNFLTKYAEANNMQKRMLRVSKRLADCRRKYGESPQLQNAERLLHQGQCNCAYWHGQFGGLYLNHLRTAIYEHLIRADNTLDQLEHWDGAVRCTGVDFDGDGQLEYVLENALLTAFINPNDGGTLFELDFKPGNFNLLNTLTRREEPYHSDLASEPEDMEDEGGEVRSIHDHFQSKEKGLGSLLFYDSYRRSSLREHFYATDLDIESLYRNEAGERSDFTTKSYVCSVEGDSVVLSASGVVYQNGEHPVNIQKCISLDSGASRLRIRYDISHCGDAPFDILFGVEFSINFLTGSAENRYYHSDERPLQRPMLGVRGVEADLTTFALRDEWQQLEAGLALSDPGNFYFFPLETVSQSECGQERVHQGSVVLPTWRIRLEPGVTIYREVDFYINQMNS